ncbi:hypothetical protein DLJ48_04200 [Oenococcus sicerae]|uniref:Uncharacterized protein n=1 Tax=Oenococcus sicerae TaxID=2203724 RepID=A0AAJ1VQG7_9LACO|nr:hypothetical protein [Oenococcus sicerae]MDN6900172.1 hypothetical protein [Oenococcus sicerae]QAS69778.1 hypothetical protein DLJ48_04200 [Oenococcus sicerae]
MTDRKKSSNQFRLIFDILWPVSYILLVGVIIFSIYAEPAFTANGRLLASIVVVLVALALGLPTSYHHFKKDGFVGKRKSESK